MPRGVPNSGFRNRASKPDKIAKIVNVAQSASAAAREIFETDEEIEAKLADRFEILASMTEAAISGDVRALIVSGPAGLGKSFTVEKALETWDPNGTSHSTVKGYVRAPGLYKLLYQHRGAGQVLVFDDADTIFFDDTSVNLLKAVCDSTDRRVVSYITEGSLIDEETAERLPKSFQFDGTIIFISNMDFDAMIDRGHKLAPHLQALVSRSHYIDLDMKSTRDYLVRIRQVVRDGLLRNINLDEQGQADVMAFIEANHNKLRELSLRMALKIGVIRRRGAGNWKKVAAVTCCKS
jgi:hypothetical protein